MVIRGASREDARGRMLRRPGGEGRGRAERVVVVRVFSRVTGWELPDAPRHPGVDFLPPREQTVFRARLKTETTRGRRVVRMRRAANVQRKRRRVTRAPRPPTILPPPLPTLRPSIAHRSPPRAFAVVRARPSRSAFFLRPPRRCVRSVRFLLFSRLVHPSSLPPPESPASSIHPTGRWCVIRILRAS